MATTADTSVAAPSASPATSPASSVELACTADEVARFLDLGLGRGIDATNSTPWLNKTSFQVRRVCFPELVGTDEGGALQSYVKEISSSSSQKVQMKSSVTVPQSPVTIGVDGEMSRSTNTTRRSVGKKVLNRTISYREDLDDVPVDDNTRVDDTSSIAGVENLPTFEERLAKWIRERMKANKGLDHNEGDESSLQELRHVIQQGKPEDRLQIRQACRDFVNHFRITHYVSAIELGAAEYIVMSSSQLQLQMKIGGKLGVDAVASASVSTTVTDKNSKKSKSTKKIGTIKEDGTVTRRSYGEAVVGVKTEPISRLVKTRFLQLSLQLALVQFMEETEDVIDGPFIIACADDELYLKVNRENGSVIATKKIEEASDFYIMQVEDHTDDPDEFLIAYYPRRKEHPVPRYLDAPVSFLGYNHGPLKMRNSVVEANSRFVLHNRLMKNRTSIDLTNWVRYSESYYINCSRRRFACDGYVAVKKVQEEGEINYVTACVPSISYHNESNIFMLFHLLPYSMGQQNPSTLSGQSKGILEQIQSLTGDDDESLAKADTGKLPEDQ